MVVRVHILAPFSRVIAREAINVARIEILLSAFDFAILKHSKAALAHFYDLSSRMAHFPAPPRKKEISMSARCNVTPNVVPREEKNLRRTLKM